MDTDGSLGNIAVGTLHHFLPVIVKMVETDSAQRLLSLPALKEVSNMGLILISTYSGRYVA